jgi:hypothetical protein
MHFLTSRYLQSKIDRHAQQIRINMANLLRVHNENYLRSRQVSHSRTGTSSFKLTLCNTMLNRGSSQPWRVYQFLKQ